jgi:hypothetical protein
MSMMHRFHLTSHGAQGAAAAAAGLYLASGTGTTDNYGHFVAGDLLLLPANSLDFGWAASVYEGTAGVPANRGDAIFRVDQFWYWSSGPASINGDLQFRYVAVLQAYYASQMDRPDPNTYKRSLDFTLKLFIPHT